MEEWKGEGRFLSTRAASALIFPHLMSSLPGGENGLPNIYIGIPKDWGCGDGEGLEVQVSAMLAVLRSGLGKRCSGEEKDEQ